MGTAPQPERAPIAPPEPVVPTVLPLRQRLLRPTKITVSAALLLAGAYGILNEQRYVSSGDAVVSAYVASVRTPIDGMLNGMSVMPGERVAEGSVLGHVENPRVDQQRLQSLRDTEELARNGTTALAEQLDELEAQRRKLLAHARAYGEAVTARLRSRTMEAERLLAAKRAALDESTLELRRARLLHDNGIVSNAELERMTTQFDVAVHEEVAQRASLTALRLEAEAASRGVLIEPGINDAAYSRQRADEVELRLSEVKRALVELESQSRQAESNLANETQRSDLMHHADLVSPIDGIVWKMETLNGEQVTAGESLIEIVECNQQFVLVDLPQDRVPELAFGQLARFRLSGEAVERTGRLLSLVENPKKQVDRKLAALPDAGAAGSQTTVRLSLEPEPETCSIGRTARVLLPTTGQWFITRWYRRYF
jgi:multidrug resistance efflux pump